MKVKDVIEFLSHCNPEAIVLSEDLNGYNHELEELDSGECFHLDEKSSMLMSVDCVYAFFKEKYYK